MILRDYSPADCPQLAALFFDTVHIVCADDYTEDQRNAWADGQVDLDAWNRSLSAHVTKVAVEGNTIVGFADMDKTGCLDRLFVHWAYLRRGIATALCTALEQAVDTDSFYTHASLTARPFFEQRGYRVVQEQTVERSGVVLTNYRMEKPKKEAVL